MKPASWGISYLSMSQRPNAKTVAADNAGLAPIRPEAWAAWARASGIGAAPAPTGGDIVAATDARGQTFGPYGSLAGAPLPDPGGRS